MPQFSCAGLVVVATTKIDIFKQITLLLQHGFITTDYGMVMSFEAK